jgi:hypothetical protein
MRVTVALLGSITLFFVGGFAIAEAASQSYDPAVVNGTNATAAAWNTTEGVMSGVLTAGSGAVVWAGVAAVVMVALLWLVLSFGGGRR